MRKCILLMIVLQVVMLTHCQEPVLEKRTRFFNAYMKKVFPDYVIEDGEYLFFLPGGCTRCIRSTLTSLLADPEIIQKRYNALLVSQATLIAYTDKILTLHSTVLCDTTNKLDRMSFGIEGISVLKIRDKKIVAFKSITIEDFQQGTLRFFTDPL